MYTHYSTSHCVLSVVLSRVESISITKGQNIKGDNTQNIRVIYLLSGDSETHYLQIINVFKVLLSLPDITGSNLLEEAYMLCSAVSELTTHNILLYFRAY